MQTTVDADISKMQMDLEQHLSEPIRQGQNVIKKNLTMAFFSEKHKLYLETDVSVYEQVFYK